MKSRAALWLALLAFLLPVHTAGQQTKSQPEAPAVIDWHHAKTMAGMRSVVPNLIALGWDDFFLSKADQIALTPAQGQELYHLALAFLASTEDLNKRIEDAERELYDKMDQDQVSLREIEDQARWIGSLRAELVVLRLQYLVRAVNVLTHEQHMALAESLRTPALGQLPSISEDGNPFAGPPRCLRTLPLVSSYNEVLQGLRETAHRDAWHLSAFFEEVSKEGHSRVSSKSGSIVPHFRE